MQVKKFEARTMKEALEMVKKQLGPEAIILSARDNQKSFGLVGEGSVEITAAISEETLRKKQIAEAKMREADRERFQNSSARSQKQFIEKVANNNKQTSQNKEPRIHRPMTSQKYIDIIDDDNILPSLPATGTAADRIKNAAQRAWTAMQDQPTEFEIQKPHKLQPQFPQNVASIKANEASGKSSQKVAPSTLTNSEDISSLKNEITSLKQIISQFQQMPQHLISGGYPGAQFGIPYDLSFMFEKLINAGVDNAISADILGKLMKDVPQIKFHNKAFVDGWVAKHILESTAVSADPTGGKVHCFVGVSGSGKTTSLVKLASHLVVREGKKVALLTTDTFKVGAAEQMRIYSQILNVPFSIIRNAGDWDVISRYLSNVDCVLVDFPGLSLKSENEIYMLQKLLPPETLQARIHLVLSALAKDQDITELARRYSAVEYQDVVFTCLDESIQHGCIYNFMKRFNVPLHSFSIGPRVPEDFEYATKERVLDLIYKITKAQESETAAV